MQEVTENIINDLKARTDKETVVDVGNGIEKRYSVCKDRFRAALTELAYDENYSIRYVPIKDIVTKPVTMKVLVKSDADMKEVISKARALYTVRAILIEPFIQLNEGSM